MYSIRVFSFSGDIYHEVILPGSAHVREILSGTVDAGLRRQLVYDGRVLPDHAELSQVFPVAGTSGADLQLLIQKRRLERVKRFTDNMNARTLQISLGGQTGVGKTSLVRRYCFNEFEEGTRPTMLSVIPKDFEIQRVLSDDGTGIKLLFWDEQLFYRAHYVPRFRHGLHAVILVFDITNRQSFESLHQWIQAAAWEGKTRTMVLMGNKTDLDAHRKVTYQEAQAFAQSEGLVYFEGSAKQNVGVEELVHHVAFEALARLVADEPPVPPDDNLEVKTSTTSCQVL